jgi:hypothetical protein
VEVELDPKFDSLGVSHTHPAWLRPIMDFPQPHCRVVDRKIEPYINAWASLVQKLKVHEKAYHAKIESSSKLMDSMQGRLLHEVWIVPTWESVEAQVLALHLAILPAQLHVHNPLNMSLNM